MRPLMLDTCAILWIANGELHRFSAQALDAMRETQTLCMSPISEWEISQKTMNHMNGMNPPAAEAVASRCQPQETAATFMGGRLAARRGEICRSVREREGCDKTLSAP